MLQKAEMSVPTLQKRKLRAAKIRASFKIAWERGRRVPPRPWVSHFLVYQAATGSLLPGDKFLAVIAEAKRVAHFLDGIFILVFLAQKSFHFLLVTWSDVLESAIKDNISIKKLFAFWAVNFLSVLAENTYVCMQWWIDLLSGICFKIIGTDGESGWERDKLRLGDGYLGFVHYTTLL